LSRNLVTVQKIKSLDPIKDKDRIVYASFENSGFHVIVGKDDFKAGDFAVYAEADTLLPDKPEFEFLRKRCWNEKWQGHRITCMKMAGVFSEGIAFPLKILGFEQFNVKEGEDVTDLIGARKYDPELLEEKAAIQVDEHGWLVTKLLKIPAFKNWRYPKTSGSWPSYIHKSDETRAQSLMYIFEDQPWKKGTSFYATEKVDGQSCTYAFLKKGWRNEFVVCSRNNRYVRPAGNNYWDYALKNDVKTKMAKLRKMTGHDIYVQGELLGPGIQKNKYEFAELQFLVYAMYDITEKQYVEYPRAKALCLACGFQWVPELEITPWKWNSIEGLVEYSKAKSVLNPKQDREGVVIRSLRVLPAERGMTNQLSFKIINPNFQLKEMGS